MPSLRVETNVSASAFDVDTMSSELMAAVAKTLGKPISYCMVVIVPDVHLVRKFYNYCKEGVIAL